MGPLSGGVVWKILYRFGDEDLVIWTATNASMKRSTASEVYPLCVAAFIDISLEIYQNTIFWKLVKRHSRYLI